MIFITGDTHGQNDVKKLLLEFLPDDKKLTRDDYVIIAGDFGGVWFGNECDNLRLKFYEEKEYTVLFVDGNHENFDALEKYPTEIWNEGKIHRIRPNIIHLMRGQIYEIEGKSFFTFGGGISIDQYLRVPFVNWWPQEEPNSIEIEEALNNLEKHGNKVDYIITHAAPEKIMRNDLCQIKQMLKCDCATEKFLNHIYHSVAFGSWFCGHYHMDISIEDANLFVLYQSVVELTNKKVIWHKSNSV